jgi:hypothetical protein
MTALIIGAVVALLAALGQWLHRRAVITAEQRGRIDALESVRRDTEAAERDRAAAVERVREDVREAVDGARASVPAGAVTAEERDAWARPPKGPAS